MKLQGWAVAGKSWTAFVGSLLAVLIPWLLTTVVPTLPEPWPALVGGIVALMTAVGVYHAPYQPVPQQGPTGEYPAPSTGGTPWPSS